jgi:hypothetical protein
MPIIRVALKGHWQSHGTTRKVAVVAYIEFEIGLRSGGLRGALSGPAPTQT